MVLLITCPSHWRLQFYGVLYVNYTTCNLNLEVWEILPVLNNYISKQFSSLDMRLLPLITVVLLMSGAINGNEKILSKIICSLKRLVNTDIFIKNQNPYPIRLIKQIFHECNFKVRIVMDNTAISNNDLIAFAYSEIQLKVWILFLSATLLNCLITKNFVWCK